MKRLFLLMLTLATACQRRDVPATRNTAPVLEEARTWREKRSTGADFTALGPGWSLDVDFAGQMTFRPAMGAPVVLPTPKPRRNGRSVGILLDGQQKRQKLRVLIEPNVCREGKQEYAYAVQVAVGSKGYTGCGAFIRGSSRLTGTWTLESLGGQRHHAGQFPNGQIPTLTIDLRAGQVSGYAGCNALRGSITAEGDHLRLKPAAATRRACVVSAVENDFLKALDRATLFRIVNGRLTLLGGGQYLMTLRKAADRTA